MLVLDLVQLLALLTLPARATDLSLAGALTARGLQELEPSTSGSMQNGHSQFTIDFTHIDTALHRVVGSRTLWLNELPLLTLSAPVSMSSWAHA